MASETQGAETGGLEFHPMDQFNVESLFGGPIAWYTPTNVTLWLGLAILAVIGLMVLTTNKRSMILGSSQAALD